MNAAQKAWATRRALAEQRQHQETIKQGVETPPPGKLEGAKIITMWCDDHRIGCGYRPFVPVEVGPRWVVLFQPASLHTLKIDRVTFDKMAKPEKGATPRRTAAIIRRNVAQAKRINGEASRPVMPEGGSRAAQAIAVLREKTAEASHA